MLDYINTVTSVISTIFGELTTLFTYFDSYPILYYILLLSICLESVVILRALMRLN